MTDPASPARSETATFTFVSGLPSPRTPIWNCSNSPRAAEITASKPLPAAVVGVMRSIPPKTHTAGPPAALDGDDNRQKRNTSASPK
jgi:hypothetical protein